MNIKHFILVALLSILSSTILVAESSVLSTPWRISLSNAYSFDKFDNIQVDFNRRLNRTWELGIYGRYVNHIFECQSIHGRMSLFNDPTWLPEGGFLPVGQSGQLGLQVSAHLLRPESALDFWVQLQVGANMATHRNAAGNYWYNEGQTDLRHNYSLTEASSRTFVNPELAINVGLSYTPLAHWSIFVSPGINGQILTKNHRTSMSDGNIAAYFTARWGICFSF